MKNKSEVVVITGATAGVGRATVRAFAEKKARIGLIARDQKRLEETRMEVERAGGQAIPFSMDVVDDEAMGKAAWRVEQELGPIDIWVNSAMTTIFSPFMDITPEEYTRATLVTYMGVVNGTRSALRHMLARDCGTIVQVGSALSYRSIPLQAPYCGAKFAIRGFTDAIRTELIGRGSNVHITMVQLPAVNTPQFSWCRAHLPRTPRPVAPVFQPEVAARAVYWTAHHRRREVDVGAFSAAVIQGNKLFPGIADRLIARKALDGQMTSTPIDPDRADNLFSPVPGPFSAHGQFDDESSGHSLQLWANTHRKWIGGTAALLAVAGTWLLGRRNGRRPC